MILLVAFGKRSYWQYAQNLAKSIKHYSNVPIQLVCDSYVSNTIDRTLFDVVSVRENDYFMDPCKVKLSLYDLSVFDKTLYLDVDAICLQDITPLLEHLDGQSIYVQALSRGKINQSVNYTPWADTNTWVEHYGIKDLSGTIHGFQSSIIYFEKSSKYYWESIKELYKYRLEPHQYSVMWGQSKQHPDELYHTINFFKLGLEAHSIQPIIYPDKYYTNEQIFSHYFMSQWGNVNVARYAFDIYDAICDAIGIETQKAFHLYRNKLTSSDGKVYE